MKHEEDTGFKEDIKFPKDAGGRQQTKGWRRELARALSSIGKERKTSPMKRVANLFYDDDSACLGILRFMLPQLKSVEANIEQVSPFKLIIDLSPEEEDKDDEEDDPEKREPAG